MTDEQQTDGLDKTVERRDEDDRREEDIEPESDKRAEGDRRDDMDRRGIHINLENPNEEFVHEVVTWLIDNTGESWSMGPAEHEPAESPVAWRIRFERQVDKDAFTDWLDTFAAA